MPPGANAPSSTARSSGPPATGSAAEAHATDSIVEAEAEAAPEVPALAVPAREVPARPGTRSANRAAKRAASGRPPAGTPARRPPRSSNTTWAVVGLAGVAVLVTAAVIAFGNPFGGPGASASPAGSPVAYGDGTCPTSQPEALAAGERRTVTIETELGNIVLEIDGSRAPIATGNFLALVECEYYDGVVFHRLVPGFVIQGGDPDGTGSGPGPGYRIRDDPLVGDYRRGTVAMARTSLPDSQGSQFFIVLADSADATLKTSQYPYAILGEVTSGMEIVDQIAAMPNSGEPRNEALDPVAMLRVTATPAGASPSPASSVSSSAPATETPASPSAAPSQ